MRGEDRTSGALFSYIDVEARVPTKHRLRAMRRLTNAALAELDARFCALYEAVGRPSIPPERLLRATLLQLLYSIRSERQLVERLEFDMLFRWFVGLSLDETVFDASTFSKNRDRLLTHEIAQGFLASLLGLPEVKRLLSAEHFSVDGTMLKAWASMKSFRPKDGSGEPPSPGRNGEADFRKTKRSNATHASTTDKDARLYRKGDGQESRLCYLGHALMENRNGLMVAAEATLATGTAETRGGGRADAGSARGGDIGRGQELRRRGLRRRAEAPQDRAAHRHQWLGEQAGQGSQDRCAAVGRGQPSLCDQPAAAQTHRGRLRLEQDRGRARPSEGARPRQGPRRVRLRCRRLQHRAAAQALGPDGRSVSGGVKNQGTMTRGRAHRQRMNPSQAKKSVPDPCLAQTH